MPGNDRENTGRAGFVATHWTAISLCAQDDERAFAARSELCQTYWMPVNSFLLRAGYSSHDAEDLTQGFFLSILARPWFEKADHAKGRFRNFLIITLRRYVQREAEKRRAQKRGGLAEYLPMEFQERSTPFQRCGELDLSQLAFDADWAAAMIECSLRRVKAEFTTAGKLEDYLLLRPFLSQMGDAAAYQKVAGIHGTSAAAIQIAVHRLRKRYAAVLREEIARTVSTAAEVQDEYRHIQKALAAGLISI